LVDSAYVDTSVLVKIYDVREPRASEVLGRLRNTRLASSVLVRAEIMSAVARKVRAGELSKTESAGLRRRIDRDYQRILKVRLNEEVLREAEKLLFEFPLRASDAVHLGSAAVLSRRVGIALPVLTADDAMRTAASGARMEVEYFG
jgi:predicted nucleic acid-binding protein